MVTYRGAEQKLPTFQIEFGSSLKKRRQRKEESKELSLREQTGKGKNNK